MPVPHANHLLPVPQAGRTGPSLRRGKTLTRPERQQAPVPLITPPATTTFTETPLPGHNTWDWWVIWSYATTFWAPPFLLKAFGIKDKSSRQAWREKFTLCWIALMLGGVVGFVTMGLNRALCPSDQLNQSVYSRLGTQQLTVGVAGWQFNVSTSLTQESVDFYDIAKRMPGQDITNLFQRSLSSYPACAGHTARYATTPLCASSKVPGVVENGTLQGCALPALSDATYSALRIQNTSIVTGYSWDQVAKLPAYLVIDGNVLNFAPYLSANPTSIAGDSVDFTIRLALNQQRDSGKDATRLFHNRDASKNAVECLVSRYAAGRIDKITPGCFVASLLLYTSLIVILAVVFVRFAMACLFNWFMSAKLVLPPKNLDRRGISPAVMPEGANVSVNNQTGTAPWAAGGKKSKHLQKTLKPDMSSTSLMSTSSSSGKLPEPTITLSRIGAELFAVCLVTCYSEGEDSIRTTVESIAATNYSDKRKLLWIVCDGMITGQGEKQSTPDICVGMLDADPRFGNPMPMGYIAVGSGAKRENRAMVYAGHYVTKRGHRTPTIVVVKCGMPAESKDKKPGNRGKRDSQLILMHFFSRVTYNDRMSPLDFDMFRKIQTLMGITPDYFEVVLMVDADTKIYPDSLKHLVNCMQHDNAIMGVCGETRIANKRQSWVTAIQVYEYFISHHLAKAFESVFGGVTCLPGCFSMYRLKARKDFDNDWVPVLVKPEIVREYAQSNVVTLHQKNLLLLGEDRFLTTLMLRTFPRRKMMFCPQARCRTVAPDTFSVLLSQRRRWINSTIHNLMELVRVRNLCGTFCFSMQFVVFMDLVGTVVLPVAISLTMALIVNSIITPPKSFQEAIPLLLLAAVLGLPGILILITTRKVIYVAWMFIYLLALPIWNFVLPLYAFWHFDDFSWGETRRVEGELKSQGHDDKTAVFDGTTIPLRRWEDWERSRLRKLRREEKRRKQFERTYGNGGFHMDDSSDGHGGNLYPNRGWVRSEYDGSDSNSVFSSEDDVWGADVGAYNENAREFPPAPLALLPDTIVADAPTLGKDEMEAMLNEGFDDIPTVGYRPQAPHGEYNLHRQGGQPAQQQSAAQVSRFQLSDKRTMPSRPPPASYVPLDSPNRPHTPGSGNSHSSAVESRPSGAGHAKKRSGGATADRYGPLGPLVDEEGPPRPAKSRF